MTNTEDGGVIGAGGDGTKIMSESEHGPTVIDGSVAGVFGILKGPMLHKLSTDIGICACLICTPTCLKYDQLMTEKLELRVLTDSVE